MLKGSLLFFAFLVFFEVSQAQNPKIYPHNEIYKDSSLVHFICKLQYALIKKDQEFLLSVLDPNIKISFGGHGGIEDFKTMWKPQDPKSEIWVLLSKLISLGGKYDPDQGSYTFPYLFDVPPPNGDSYTLVAITGKNVNVRQQPSRTGSIVGQLSYEWVNTVLPSQPSAATSEWLYIESFDKKIKGYVFKEYAWELLNYRMRVEKQKNEWKITILVAGD